MQRAKAGETIEITAAGPITVRQWSKVVMAKRKALFEATGNLVAPVLAHGVVNALNLRWLAARPG